MSCRVQNKKVHNAFFFWLQRHALAQGTDTLSVRSSETAKNGAASLALTETRFDAKGDSGYHSAPDPANSPTPISSRSWNGQSSARNAYAHVS